MLKRVLVVVLGLIVVAGTAFGAWPEALNAWKATEAPARWESAAINSVRAEMQTGAQATEFLMALQATGDAGAVCRIVSISGDKASLLLQAGDRSGAEATLTQLNVWIETVPNNRKAGAELLRDAFALPGYASMAVASNLYSDAEKVAVYMKAVNLPHIEGLSVMLLFKRMPPYLPDPALARQTAVVFARAHAAEGIVLYPYVFQRIAEAEALGEITAEEHIAVLSEVVTASWRKIQYVDDTQFTDAQKAALAREKVIIGRIESVRQRLIAALVEAQP